MVAEIENNHNYHIDQVRKFKFLGYVPYDELGFQKFIKGGQELAFLQVNRQFVTVLIES